MKPKSWSMAIMRLGEAFDGEAFDGEAFDGEAFDEEAFDGTSPKDSSKGKLRPTPAACRKVRRDVLMSLFPKEQRALNHFVNERANAKLRRTALFENR